MCGKVDEGTRKKEEAEGKGRRIEGGGKGGGQGGPKEPQGSPREAPERPQGGPRRPHEATGAARRPQTGPREKPGRPQSDPRGGPGGPARRQELPRDPSILQEMQSIKNHTISIDFHSFQVAEAQDDASIEALKIFRKIKNSICFSMVSVF